MDVRSLGITNFGRVDEVYILVILFRVSPNFLPSPQNMEVLNTCKNTCWRFNAQIGGFSVDAFRNFLKYF